MGMLEEGGKREGGVWGVCGIDGAALLITYDG